MVRFIHLIFILIISSNDNAFAENNSKVPPAKFQGVWKVEKVTGDSRSKSEERRPISDNHHYVNHEIRFRRHESGAIQQIWNDDEGRIVKSRGIEIVKITDNDLTYREWRFHKVEYKTLTLLGDGKAMLTWNFPKDSYIYELSFIRE